MWRSLSGAHNSQSHFYFYPLILTLKDLIWVVKPFMPFVYPISNNFCACINNTRQPYKYPIQVIHVHLHMYLDHIYITWSIRGTLSCCFLLLIFYKSSISPTSTPTSSSIVLENQFGRPTSILGVLAPRTSFLDWTGVPTHVFDYVEDSWLHVYLEKYVDWTINGPMK